MASSNGVGVYVQWGWRIVPIGVAYKSKGAKMAHTSNEPYKHTERGAFKLTLIKTSTILSFINTRIISPYRNICK